MSYKSAIFLLVCLVHSVEGDVHKRSDDTDVAALNTEVIRLAGQVTSLTAELTAMKNQFASQGTKIERLDKTGSVAFHAYGGSTLSTVPLNGNVLFSRPLVNLGQAFDPQTGFFTAPVSGLYQFHATVMANPSPASRVFAELLVGGVRYAKTLSDSRHGYYDNTGLHAVVHVLAGKKVSVRNDVAAGNYYSSSYLTFSGVLLRAD